MTTEGLPRGVRDNGLRCTGYSAIADLDPRIADRLLAELRDAGIAAYAAPTPGSVGGYMETRLPDRPIDRLWVDTAEVPRARTLVDSERSEEIDFDAAWEQMVASLRGGTETPSWPDDAQPDEASYDDTRSYDPADEDHFEPPPPPPLPRLRSVTFAALLAIAVGLVILATDFDGGSFTVVAVVAIIGGVVSLVWNMRNGPPGDSGWDDGAVV